MEPSKAVFLSYASEDTENAARICEGLRSAGIEVWFDRSELRGGDVWDQSIRRNIKDCALFLPVISANTNARAEGYFRLEWKLAVDRSHLMSGERAFLLPVVIDDTTDGHAVVPDRFREVQWSHLPEGRVPAAFVELVSRLLEPAGKLSGMSALQVPPPAAAPAGWHSLPRRRVLGAAVAAAAGAAVLGISGGWWWSSKGGSAGGFVPAVVGVPAVAGAADARSIAVLPFVNLSSDKEQEYFSDGISEELLSVLQKIPGLHVAARMSAFSFKGTTATVQEIGVRLGVANVIEGSVRKAGNMVRISARLSRAATGEQTWADSYTRDLKDVFAMQSELAQTIVGQLRAQLGGAVTASSIAEIKAEVQTAGKGGTTNLEAYQFYLQGLFFLNQFSPDTAVRAAEYLEHAVKLDPQYAFAWAALSKAGTIQIGYANTKQGFEQGTALARRAVDRALALQPDLAAAQLAKMRVQIWGDYNWKGGRESLRRASQAAPEEASIIAAAAELAYQLGQMENAVDFGREAVARDPVNTEVRGIFAFALLRLGRYAEAEAQFRRVIELNPKALWGHGGLAQLFLRQARFDEAMREADREDVEWTRYTVQSMALWSLGKQAESDAVLAKLTTGYADVSAYQIAQAYAYRGQNDLAFQWLERAYRQRDSGISFLRAELTLENLHNDARWPVFLAKVGLADSQLN